MPSYSIKNPWLQRAFSTAAKWFGEEVPAPVQPANSTGRIKLPDRRRAMRDIVRCKDSHGVERPYDVGFGIDDAGAIREVFCIPKDHVTGDHIKTGSDIRGFMDDACIALSIALQHGARIGDFVKFFGELRPEGEKCGPPASPMGAIARAGAQLEVEIAEGRA